MFKDIENIQQTQQEMNKEALKEAETTEKIIKSRKGVVAYEISTAGVNVADSMARFANMLDRSGAEVSTENNNDSTETNVDDTNPVDSADESNQEAADAESANDNKDKQMPAAEYRQKKMSYMEDNYSELMKNNPGLKQLLEGMDDQQFAYKSNELIYYLNNLPEDKLAQLTKAGGMDKVMRVMDKSEVEKRWSKLYKDVETSPENRAALDKFWQENKELGYVNLSGLPESEETIRQKIAAAGLTGKEAEAVMNYIKTNCNLEAGKDGQSPVVDESKEPEENTDTSYDTTYTNPLPEPMNNLSEDEEAQLLIAKEKAKSQGYSDAQIALAENEYRNADPDQRAQMREQYGDIFS